MMTFSIFSTLLKDTLEEIVNGHHNDENCKEYEEKYESIHRKSPQFCRFKDHPDLIPKLLDKIFIESNDEVEDSQQSQSDSEESDSITESSDTDSDFVLELENSEQIPNLPENAISVHTFHSLGLEILGQATGSKPTLSKLAEDNLALQNFINFAIRSNLEDKHYRDLLKKWFTEFFAPYESEFDFENYGQYWSYIKKHKIRSLKGELVKSFEECEIANFLYTQGIDYIYEADYEHKTSDSRRRQYQPDFWLPEYEIYIEHLGLRGFGRTAPFVDRREYLQSLRWKRDLHKQHGTTLVETYSCEKSQGILTLRLKEKLEEKGVVFNEIDPEKMFDLLHSLAVIFIRRGSVRFGFNHRQTRGKMFHNACKNRRLQNEPVSQVRFGNRQKITAEKYRFNPVNGKQARRKWR